MVNYGISEMAENNASTREFVSDYVVQFGKLLAGIWRD